MQNNIQNIVLKSISGIIVLLGVILTVVVMGKPNPRVMSDEEFEQIAIKEAKQQGLATNMTQMELDGWKRDRISEIKTQYEQEQWSSVSTIMDFTTWILIICGIAVIGAFGYLATVDMKKALFSFAGIAGLTLFLFIVYQTASSDVPAEFVAKELKSEGPKLFTPDNWKIAEAGMTATYVLAIVAILGWVGGEILKIFK